MASNDFAGYCTSSVKNTFGLVSEVITCQVSNVKELASRHDHDEHSYETEMPDYPRFTLSQICPNLSGSEFDTTYPGFEYPLVGTWDCPRWKVSLVFRPNPEEEHRYNHKHGLALIMTHKFVDDPRQARSIAQIHDFCFYSSEPIELTIAKGFRPKTTSVYATYTLHKTLSPVTSSIVIPFDSKKWIWDIRRFGKTFNHPYFTFALKFQYQLTSPTTFVQLPPPPSSPQAELTDAAIIARSDNGSTFINMMNRVDYFNLLVDAFDLPTISSLQKTCKKLRFLLAGRISHRIRLGMGSFFPKPDALELFVQCLRDTGAIISGSTALKALLPPRSTPWQTGDLDIIVDDARRDMLIQFLINQGYIHNPHVFTAPGHHNNYPLTWRWVVYHNAITGRKIDLCVVPLPERSHYILAEDEAAKGGHQEHLVLRQMLNYHSSVVMNFFDGWRFVSVFPGWTRFEKNLKNSFVNPSERADRALQKYVDRGFSMVKVPSGADVDVNAILASGIQPKVEEGTAYGDLTIQQLIEYEKHRLAQGSGANHLPPFSFPELFSRVPDEEMEGSKKEKDAGPMTVDAPAVATTADQAANIEVGDAPPPPPPLPPAVNSVEPVDEAATTVPEDQTMEDVEDHIIGRDYDSSLVATDLVPFAWWSDISWEVPTDGQWVP